MRILAIMLGLVAVLGHRPSTPKAPIPVGPGEIWRMDLPEAIRIGLDNPETVRCVRIGSTEIPLGGFEPTGEPGPDDE